MKVPGIAFDPDPRELLPGPSTKRGGYGLGIPVAWKICHAHGRYHRHPAQRAGRYPGDPLTPALRACGRSVGVARACAPPPPAPRTARAPRCRPLPERVVHGESAVRGTQRAGTRGGPRFSSSTTRRCLHARVGRKLRRNGVEGLLATDLAQARAVLRPPQARSGPARHAAAGRIGPRLPPRASRGRPCRRAGAGAHRLRRAAGCGSGDEGACRRLPDQTRRPRRAGW